MRTIEKTLYQFDELDEQGKERARDWFRSIPDEYDTEYVIDDFEEVCKILGVELSTYSVPLMNEYGETRKKSKVWYSYSCSQGDGASFEGYYSYRKGSTVEIRKYAPSDIELHSIADQLREAQRKFFYALNARIQHRGHYVHSNSMEIDVDHNDYLYLDSPAFRVAEDTIRDCMKSLADWLYAQIGQEIDFRNSDEQVDETIRANEYEFTEEGVIA